MPPKPSKRHLRLAQLRRLAQFEKKQTKLTEFLAQEHLDANGNAIIAINCEGLAEFFHPMSCGVQKELSLDLFDFIDLKAYPVPNIYPIVIRFLNWRGDDAQKRRIRTCLLEHYLLILRDKEDDLRLNLNKALMLFLFGAMVLVASFALNQKVVDPFIAEFLSIVATFSLWEAVGLILLDRRQLRIERMNSGQLAMAEVEFESGGKPTDG